MHPLIAAAQMKSGDDLDANFKSVNRLCEEAKARGASLICLPENFAFLPPKGATIGEISEPLTGPLFSRYAMLAKRHSIEISFGGFPERAPDGRAFNTHVVVDKGGHIVATYRKIHLFVVDLPDGTVHDESLNYQPGNMIATAPSSAGLLGLSICYDLRFVELYRELVHSGALILLVPAAFTATTGKAHWEVLLRARAIENQCYVVAAAQYGQHYPGRASHGHAMIVDPWGTIIAQVSETEGLAIAAIDHAYLASVRANMPMASHRRPDIFQTS